MKPIKIEIWTRGPYIGDGHGVTRTLRAHSWGAARRKALDALGPVVTTDGCYHRDMARAPWATLSRGGRVETLSPVADIVPSVGELGWAP